jgi:uncharacterized protein YyaL (SSP411 family)
MTANRLADSASAYLKSAAHQPVHWHPWGEEAFGRARAQDKPVLLDIGAVWCHWCHVMDGESYEDPALAHYLNEHFICIKVDRDERPDVDARYQRAVQALTAQGGWPLTAFLTPDGEVFYGGTYFPPDGKFGRPGFHTVLGAVLEAYQDRRDQVKAQAQTIRRLVDAQLDEGARGDLAPDVLDAAVRQIARVFDRGTAARRAVAFSSRPSRSSHRWDTGDEAPSWTHAPGHGAGRHARPARRRLPPLQRGREVDRAALREDVVRQLGAAEGLSRCLRGVRD